MGGCGSFGMKRNNPRALFRTRVDDRPQARRSRKRSLNVVGARAPCRCWKQRQVCAWRPTAPAVENFHDPEKDQRSGPGGSAGVEGDGPRPLGGRLVSVSPFRRSPVRLTLLSRSHRPDVRGLSRSRHGRLLRVPPTPPGADAGSERPEPGGVAPPCESDS